MIRVVEERVFVHSRHWHIHVRVNKSIMHAVNSVILSVIKQIVDELIVPGRRRLRIKHRWVGSTDLLCKSF